MKDYDELVSRFYNIHELPISEEQIGAFLEGQLSLYEMEEMGNIINQSPMLQSIIEDTSMSTLGSIENYEVSINAPLDNDFSENESYEDNIYFVDSDVHSNINTDELVIDIDSSDYNYDEPFDDSTFELPDLPFF